MITKEQWLNLVSKVDQTFEDEFKAEYNSPELMFPLMQRLLKQCSVSGALPCHKDVMGEIYKWADEIKLPSGYDEDLNNLYNRLNGFWQ